MDFESLGVSAEFCRAVKAHGYDTPTPIQEQAIPVVLRGGDVMAAAQTGTGKTAGFVLPLLQRLTESALPSGPRVPRALILTPTRELTAQVAESVEVYGKFSKLRGTAVYGGVAINPQFEALKKGVDVIIATPGRLLDHHEQGTVDLSHVEVLVLDECDRMLDMGFIRDIRRILSLLPPVRQNLLFTATLTPEIKRLSNGLLNDPVMIEVTPKITTAERVAQVVHPVDKHRKRELLSFLIGSNNWQQVLVFCRTKFGADRLAHQLEQDGLDTLAIHGNKTQGARTKALDLFKKNRVRVLVATDIAARGLDIQELPHVINYDLPHTPEDYVHRIGRTGRAGLAGEAVSLVSMDEIQFLFSIERLLGEPLPRVDIEGFEARLPAKAPKPRVQSFGPRGRGRRR